MSAPATGAIASLDDLYASFEALSMEGGWHRRRPALWPVPAKSLLPAIWRYAEVRPVLAAAGSLVPAEMAERRNLTMRNPAEGNPYATVRSLVAAYQLIRPGERALAHRHTPAALRLILDGRGAYTVVDGERVEMRPGDVLLTPSGAWHSHENAGKEDCIWLDFLDVPLVHLLEPMFFEHHPDRLEPGPRDVESSPLAFRWSETRPALAAAPPSPDPSCDRQIELGGPALPTIALHLQALGAGRERRASRTTANALYAVVEGTGTSTVDGEAFEWSRGDVLAVPSWRPYLHAASTDAILLRVSDEPVMRAFGYLRTEEA